MVATKVILSLSRSISHIPAHFFPKKLATHPKLMSLGLTPDLPPLTKPQKSAWLLGKLETFASLLPFPAPSSTCGLLPADAVVPRPCRLVGALHSGQAFLLGSRGPLAKGQ